MLGRPAPLDPGQYRIKVEALGYEPFELEITLASGQSQRVDLPLKKKASPAESVAPAEKAAVLAVTPSVQHDGPQADAASGIGAREIVLISEATVALAGLGVGVGFFLSRGAAETRIENAQGKLDKLGG